MGALGDDQIALTLGRIHGDPARQWTLDDLAKEAGMSRTSFAVRFKSAMGTSPMRYLLNWRMHLAERDIRERHLRVGEVAAAFGYASESAFSSAFKRVMGAAPGRSGVGRRKGSTGLAASPLPENA